MNHDTTAAPISIGKYVWALLIVQFVFGIAATLLELAAKVELPSSIGIVGTLASCYLAAHLFVGDHKRVPVPSEKRRFATWGTVGSIVTFVAVVLGYMLVAAGPGEIGATAASVPGEIKARPGFAAAILLGALLFALLTFGILYGIFGSFAKTSVKRLEKSMQA